MSYNLGAPMRFLEVLGEVRLLGGDEVAELAVELLSQGLGVVPGDVVGQSVLGHRSVEALLALVLKEGNSFSPSATRNPV